MGVQAKSLGVRFALLLASVWFAASETLGAQAQSDRLFSSAGEVRSEVGAGPAAPEDDPLRSRSARLDVSALSRARDAAVAGRSDSAMLTLNLFDDAVLRAVVERVERLSSDGVLISGRVVGEPFGSLHLVVRGGLVTGSVRTLGASYRIGPGAAGLHLVGEVDEPARSFECGVRDLPEIAGEALLERAERPSGRSPRSADSASSAGVAAPSILDVAVIYTSLVALAQTDMKKLIAYSSVAHMGFVTIGIFTLNLQGIQGALVQMLSHGVVSAALFLVVGVVYDRMHSREIGSYGGLVHRMPAYAAVFMVFMLASIGLPGTSGFVGEFLVLVGAFQVNTWVAALATTGIVLGAAYMLWLYRREIAVFAPLVAVVFWMGIYPTSFLEVMDASVAGLIADYNDALAAARAPALAAR